MSKVSFISRDTVISKPPNTAQPTTSRTEDTVLSSTDTPSESETRSSSGSDSSPASPVSDLDSGSGTNSSSDGTASEELESAPPPDRKTPTQLKRTHKEGVNRSGSAHTREKAERRKADRKELAGSENDGDTTDSDADSSTNESGTDGTQSSEGSSDSAKSETDDTFSEPGSPGSSKSAKVSDKRPKRRPAEGADRSWRVSSERVKRDKGSTTPTNSPPASAIARSHGPGVSDPDRSHRHRVGRKDGEEDTGEIGERTHKIERSRDRLSRGIRQGEEEEEEDGQSRDRTKHRTRTRTNVEAESETPEHRERNVRQNMIRYASLYLVPVLLSIPISLLLSLNVSLLTPLYNSLPLKLHTPALYGVYLLPAAVYWYITLSASAKDRVSARVCFSIAALSGDLVAVGGRRVGSALGHLLGPEWGAWASRTVLGVGAVGGGLGFALLCFDYISHIAPAVTAQDRPRNLGSILYRAGFYVAHIWLMERAWSSYLSNGVSILTQSPEKTILFISLLLTILSLFLRPGSSPITFSTQVHVGITRSLKLTPKASKNLTRATSLLPSQAFPILLLLRIPFMILALRQQIFLRPSHTPYITANGELRVLSSEPSLTGQIVVAENLKDGYRFLRCDHSILGGRWIREVADQSAAGGLRTEMGDSIFATFNLQEIGLLAQRSDPGESIFKTLSLTSDLEVTVDGEEDEVDKEPERALIIGLGAGIAASTFARRGMYVDIVEIDPAVYLAAHEHFELSTLPITSTNILDGASFISQLASLKRSSANHTDPDSDPNAAPETEASGRMADLVPMWDYVVQDCFTGGSVPLEMFTREFWEDLGEVVKTDGIVAMNFAGILKSKASRAVLVTLLSVFPQCRAFGDGFEKDQGPNDLVNMVVICTKTYSPLLSFRPPTRTDALRSPLRAHVYSTFHPHEIQLDSIVGDSDHADPELMLLRGRGVELDKWQVGSALATWRAMQKILTPEMWLAY